MTFSTPLGGDLGRGKPLMTLPPGSVLLDQDTQTVLQLMQGFKIEWW